MSVGSRLLRRAEPTTLFLSFVCLLLILLFSSSGSLSSHLFHPPRVAFSLFSLLFPARSADSPLQGFHRPEIRTVRRLFLAIRVVRYAGPQFRIVFNIHDFQSKSASSVVRCYFLSLVASMEIKRIVYRRVCILNLQIVIIVHRFVSLKLGATLIHHGHRNISSYQTPDSFIEVSYLIYLHFSIYGKIFQFKNCNVTQILMKR